MRLPGIGPLQQGGHGRFSLCWRDRHSIFQGLAEAGGVRRRAGPVECEAQISEIVHRHAGHNDLDPLLPQSCDGLAEAVVLDGVFAVEQGHLHDGHVQWVVVGVESCGQLVSAFGHMPSPMFDVLTALEGRPHPMVKSSLDTLNLDSPLPHQGHDFLRNVSAAHIGVLFLVVMSWELVEVTNEIGGLGSVDLDLPALRLPMSREDYHGFRLPFRGDLPPSLL